MQLDTKHFGNIEVNESDIVDFPEGLPGFEDLRKMVVLGKVEENSPFQWLQGVDNPEVAFVIIDPRIFKPDYEVNVADEAVEVLDIKDETKVLVFCIVVVPDDVNNISANLKAPILINVESNKGKQVVMERSDYQIRHYIIEELQRTGG